MSQTAKAMVYSVLATLAFVVGWLALNPQANNEFDPGVDVATAETEVAKIAAFTPATIDAPDTWRANYARWHSGAQDNIPSWNVGYLTADDDFLGIAQTSNATVGWVNETVQAVGSETQVTIAGHDVTRWIGDDDHIYYVAEFDQDAVQNPDFQSHGVEPSETMTLIVSGSMDEEAFKEHATEIISMYN